VPSLSGLPHQTVTASRVELQSTSTEFGQLSIITAPQHFVPALSKGV
jgi:hypothetical protein